MSSFLSHLTLSYLLEVIFRGEENQIFYINCTVVMQGFFWKEIEECVFPYWRPKLGKRKSFLFLIKYSGLP